jgi:hypothetical protein
MPRTAIQSVHARGHSTRAAAGTRANRRAESAAARRARLHGRYESGIDLTILIGEDAQRRRGAPRPHRK